MARQPSTSPAVAKAVEMANAMKPKTSAIRGKPARADAAQVKAQAMTTGATVTVACKTPNGFNLGHIHGPHKPPVILRGSAHKFAVGGYGLTHGIGKDEFERWQREYSWLPAVKNGLIFAHDSARHARGMAAEMGPEFHSGFEPIDPKKPGGDPRVQAAISPTEEQKDRTDEIMEEREEELDELRQITPAEEQ